MSYTTKEFGLSKKKLLVYDQKNMTSVTAVSFPALKVTGKGTKSDECKICFCKQKDGCTNGQTSAVNRKLTNVMTATQYRPFCIVWNNS